MKPKYASLIQILLNQSDFKTAKSLASAMNVSIRSIKNYIQEINTSYPGMVISSREGYRIDKERGRQLILEEDNHIPQTTEERTVYILNRLIKQKGLVDAYDICDEIYISYSTLKNELYKVKKQLMEYDLQLRNENDKLSVEGLEKNKRKLLSTILYNESNVNFINLKAIQSSFAGIDIEYIKESILEIFNENHYFINDYSLINLIVHIAIAIDRIRNRNTYLQESIEFPDAYEHEIKLAKKVSDRIEKYFNINYSDSEIYELALLLVSRATSLDYKNINITNLEEFIGKDCFSLVKEMIQSVNAYYYIDLTEPEFLIRFALHIRNLLQRSKNNYYSKNPLTEEIKTTCPLIYDVSVYLSSVIMERMGITIIDDEIAYIAFHLGSALQTQKNLYTKVTSVLYCPNYYDNNIRLTDTLNKQFSEDMLITNIYTDESELESLPKCDLIIATIPVSRILDVPMIQIGIFSSQKDIYHIRRKIDEIKVGKKKNTFRSYLEQLIIPDFFEKRNDIADEHEAIDYMTDKMVRFGYVDEGFKEDVYAREHMSTTAFHDFALPHAMKMKARKTGMNILISDKPVSWDGHPVHMIIMLCFNMKERHIFNEIFEPLTMILNDADNRHRIVQSTDYKEFIDLLVEAVEIP